MRKKYLNNIKKIIEDILILEDCEYDSNDINKIIVDSDTKAINSIILSPNSLERKYILFFYLDEYESPKKSIKDIEESSKDDEVDEKVINTEKELMMEFDEQIENLFNYLDTNQTNGEYPDIDNFKGNIENREFEIKTVFLVPTVKETIALENNSLYKNRIVKKFKDSFNKKLNKREMGNTIVQKNISYSIQQFNVSLDGSYKIEIIDRIRALEFSKKISIDQKRKKNITVISRVYYAKLKDIVELYNNIGSNLFSFNIRYGVKDILSVDSEIIKTLEEDPKNFAFFNNGISMFVDKENLNCSNQYDSIEVTFKNNNISVVNGAQTITAASNFFFKNNSDKIKAAEKDAFVLLKVLTIDGENVSSFKDDHVKKFIDNTTIALNRQKPIKEEDINYLNPFVVLFNSTSALMKYKTVIIGKKGEKEFLEESKVISLPIFARLCTAYLEKNPGDARSKSTKALLEIKEDPETGIKLFDNKELFVIDKDNLNSAKVYRKIYDENYKPLYFAFELYSKLDGIIKKAKQLDEVSNDKNLFTIIANGKLMFLSYIINRLNNPKLEKNKKFDDFNVDIKWINDNLDEMVILNIAKTYNSLLEEGYMLSSNDFKGNIKKFDELLKTELPPKE
ncbi:AIPR family protein [Breznakia pachnodae]|uniref:Abortive phage infection protein C-terminal domain-containing protein n=1 Tax=Breznakia pachnodae TaxID=265178 RepID=A0ABU0E5L3_9FIRM|nr:AIPR family protein [Breznakia pachnodae]MDQ0362189.1 hypothetical protein [Breznakia pachnodae]